jgi:hypothetical protein
MHKIVFGLLINVLEFNRQPFLMHDQKRVGKSFTSKIILARFLQKHKNIAFFIVDPESEYGNVGKFSGANILNIATENQLGFDLIQIFSDNNDTAINPC